MKEQRIVLPRADNRGNPLDRLRASLEEHLTDIYGGYTILPANGGWRSPSGLVHREPVWIFDVAAPDTAAVRDHLREIASWLANDANQEAIYVRHANGDVEFIEQGFQERKAA